MYVILNCKMSDKSNSGLIHFLQKDADLKIKM